MKKFIKAMRDLKYNHINGNYGILIYSCVTGKPYVTFLEENEPFDFEGYFIHENAVININFLQY
jgi:hypothetical protein